MQDKQSDTLDQALAALPRDIPPERDLWPTIRAQLQTAERPKPRAEFAFKWQLAAGIALMALSSAVTYLAMRPAPVQTAASAPANGASNAVPASNGAGDALAVKYMQARRDLDLVFAERVATMPPATRAKLEGNLAELRRAATQLAATLAESPSDALLQELLMSTQQRELRLLADVAQMQSPIS